MIVDTSAVIAILFAEPDAERFARAMSEADICRISAATYVELSMVVETLAKDLGGRQLDLLVKRAPLTIEPVTEEQAHLARLAYLDFGKGRHPAGLNYVDCFSYALSKATGEPLLFKGKDFTKSDIEPAL